MSSTRVYRSVLSAVVALGLSASTLLAGEPTSADAVLKFAPKDCFAIVHIEGKAVADLLDRTSKAMSQPATKPADTKATIAGAAATDAMAEFTKAMVMAKTVAQKIDSIDIYMKMPRGGMGAMDTPLPSSIVAIKTDLTPQQLLDLVVKVSPKPIPSALQPGENGRYMIPGLPLTIIDGSAASDVKEKVLLVGMDPLMQDAIKSLRTGPDKALADLAGKIDTSAPIWGVATLDFIPDATAPKAVAGALFTDGKKESTLTLGFADAAAASNLEQHFTKYLPAAKGLLQMQVKESALLFSARIDGAFAANLITQASKAAQRAASLAHVSALSKSVAMFMASNNDTAVPASFEEMFKMGLGGASLLHSPNNPNKLKLTDDGMPAEPGDYVYIILPLDAPGELIRIYELPELYNNEGTIVGRADTTVAWMTAEQFKQAMDKTQEFIKNANKAAK